MVSKRMKEAHDAYDKSKVLPLQEAIALAQKLSTEKCSPAVDIVMSLGLPKGESVRGALSPEDGIGKSKRVAVLAQGDQVAKATDAGADIVGSDDLIEMIQKGDMNFDVLIATPDMMPKVGKVGRILGPKGLMPNLKLGTVTTDVAQAVKNAKSGQIFFRSDNAGSLHARLGPVAFKPEQLINTVQTLVAELKRLKPARAKGQYIRSCFVSTTMGPGIRVDIHTLD
ncbi:50S ribosomal protein L1 [Gammaproteobacteria bacterium Comchoano-2]|uniref:Large ribosomal subunit protein uL1 n=2 Tax=Candidatus Synchoanobacter obligatus TaxID=2919597 RepID=A0ABT1L6A7_9GAMM|nr:50S ribosomal protein L1 [Candidatus Synchoanobacter obligatus]MCP8352476.1 50S ribosomal protein L1 [Candidatus Synchoanobacter obligatus]